MGSGMDLSGVSFEYWETFNVQSRAAKEGIGELISQFESDTGATVQINWSSYAGVIGAKWITNFKKGNYPVLFNGASQYNGRFAQGGWLVPFEEYKDEFDQETLDAIEWVLEPLRDSERMFGKLFDVPYSLQILGAFASRVDLIEEAGLDPSNVFPPSDYNDAIETMNAVKESGVVEYPWWIYGSKFDVVDANLGHWTVAEGGQDGMLINEAADDVNFDNDVWKKIARQYIEIHTKHDLSGPQTPQGTDEKSVPKLLGGQTIWSHTESPNNPSFNDQAPSMVENGQIQWGAGWGGNTGQRCTIYPQTLVLTQPPDGADEAKYERKQQAAIEHMKYWLSKDFQKKLPEFAGVLPVRDDVWDELGSRPTKALEVWQSQLETVDFIWANHPNFVEFMYNIPGPYIQDALKGNISPEEAMDKWAADARELL